MCNISSLVYSRVNGEGQMCNFLGLVYACASEARRIPAPSLPTTATCTRKPQMGRPSCLSVPFVCPTTTREDDPGLSKETFAAIRVRLKVALLALVAAALVHETPKVAHLPPSARTSAVEQRPTREDDWMRCAAFGPQCGAEVARGMAKCRNSRSMWMRGG